MTIIKFQNHREISEVVHVFGHYGPAPSVVFRSPELSAGAKAAYAYLCTYVSLKDVKSGKMKARPSKRRMQRELGMSNNTLNKYLKELREFGLIEVKQTRVLRDGRKEYGNNIYTLRSHVDFPLDGATSSLSGREIQKAKKLQSWIRDSWESNSLHASNTMSSNTKKTKYNHLSVLELGRTDSSDESTYSAEVTRDRLERASLSVDELIAFWNEQGVNPHKRLGSRTKARIEQALAQALEDLPAEEILGAIGTYSKMYKERRCDHKYRLVEFMEKRGYEHFLHEENWKRRKPRGKTAREDFTYIETEQDLSMFSFLRDDGSSDDKDDEH